jgi:hypothetical protein
MQKQPLNPDLSVNWGNSGTFQVSRLPCGTIVKTLFKKIRDALGTVPKKAMRGFSLFVSVMVGLIEVNCKTILPMPMNYAALN